MNVTLRFRTILFSNKLNCFLQHPGYDHLADGAPNDIVIVKLAEPVDMTNQYVNVIALPEEDEIFLGNQNCWIMGWGLPCKMSFIFFNFTFFLKKTSLKINTTRRENIVSTINLHLLSPNWALTKSSH